MEIRGVKIKKINQKNQESGLFVLKPAEHYSVPLLADDGDKSLRVVNVGERVKEGTLIGKPSGKYGSHVYSPCSGKVIGVVKKLNASGNECEHVIIMRDLDDEKEFLEDLPLVEQIPEALLKRLYESGAIDNFFPFDPAYKKYLLKNKIDEVIVNCTETEPYQTCMTALVETYTSEVVEGARLLAQIAKTNNVLFIFTNKQKKVASLVKTYIKNANLKNHVEVKIYPHVYPLNNARLIGYYETGKMVREGNRTAETSVIIESPANCYDFFLAVNKGIPVTQKVVSVGGNNCLRKANYFVKNGTPIRHILEVVGTKDADFENMLIYGGIMSGVAQETLDISATLTASSILFCDRQEYSRDAETACINCGKCVAVCPVKLHVKNLDDAITNREFFTAKQLGVVACINCGACSYACPAKRYLCQRINYAKDYVMGKKAKRPGSSEYLVVEGQDVPFVEKQFDRILQSPEKFEEVNESQITSPQIEEMLQIVDNFKGKKGEDTNE